MQVTRKSLISKTMTTMEIDVDPGALDDWWTHRADRPLIQDAFPTLTPAEREFILTGITPEQWLEHVAPAEHEADEPFGEEVVCEI